MIVVGTVRSRMKGRSSTVVVAVVLILCMVELVQCANYTVGAGFTNDSTANTSWTNTVNGLVKPAALEAAYQRWADSVNVTVGDTLVFEYRRGEHSLFLAKSEEAYKECNFSLGSADTVTDSTYTIKQSDGTLYFTCAIPGHCESGQKVIVTPLKQGNTNSTSTTPSMPSTSKASQHSNLVIVTMASCLSLVILALPEFRM